jgi:hypothetical protein
MSLAAVIEAFSLPGQMLHSGNMGEEVLVGKAVLVGNHVAVGSHVSVGLHVVIVEVGSNVVGAGELLDGTEEVDTTGSLEGWAHVCERRFRLRTNRSFMAAGDVSLQEGDGRLVAIMVTSYISGPIFFAFSSSAC